MKKKFFFCYHLSFWFIVEQIRLAHSVSRVYNSLNHSSSVYVHFAYVYNDVMLCSSRQALKLKKKFSF